MFANKLKNNEQIRLFIARLYYDTTFDKKKFFHVDIICDGAFNVIISAKQRKD